VKDMRMLQSRLETSLQLLTNRKHLVSNNKAHWHLGKLTDLIAELYPTTQEHQGQRFFC
jgi:hypothetical protein